MKNSHVELVEHLFKTAIEKDQSSIGGKCAKQVVEAVIVTDSGKIYGGSNWCANPQKTCPRDAAGYKSGEGYHLCKSVCHQLNHAEVDACINAGIDAIGSTLYMRGHSYCCKSCVDVMEKYGIEKFVIIE